MIDVYRYTGEDGSMGYRRGQLYALKTRRGTWFERYFYGWYVIIEAPIFVPYSGMDTFYDNWVLVGITRIEEKSS